MSPQQTLLYAIGDVHGRLDLLRLAADRIVEHLDGRVGGLIALGDYVDRGPDSSGVIDLLMQAQRECGAICLKGNHEAMMLQACRVRDRNSVSLWCANGGDATLRSYGAETVNEMEWSTALDAVSAEHLDWLESLPTIASDEHRIFVHAGLAPRLPADQQAADTLLWIRERFLRARRADFPDGKHIVHGHTPSWSGKPRLSAPELLEHRTNLDTGAFLSGVLTIGVFDAHRPGGPIEVLQVGDAAA